MIPITVSKVAAPFTMITGIIRSAATLTMSHRSVIVGVAFTILISIPLIAMIILCHHFSQM